MENIVSGEPSPIKQFNLGKTVRRLQAISGIIFGVIVILVTVIVAAAVHSHSHKVKDTVIVAAFGFGIGLLAILLSWVSLKQLKKGSNIPQQDSQFASAGEVNVKSSFGNATLAPNEKMIDWIGPMNMHGKGFGSMGTSMLNKETDKNPFNTLIFTDKQIVGLMFGPEDLGSVEGSGIRKLVSMGINQSSENTGDKNMQFAGVNAGKWQQIVESVMAKGGLPGALSNHLNFGLPYSSITSFNVKNRLVDPGIEFTLNDGRNVLFAVLVKDRLDSVGQSLSKYIKTA